MTFAKRATLMVGVLTLLFAITPTVSAVENSGVGGRPANPRSDNPRSESIFVHELKPGASVSDAVVVVNNTDKPKTVKVYAADAIVSSGGAFACEQHADRVDQEGLWISLSAQTVELGPNGQQKVGFDVKVPNNASGGEHNACIAIQAIEPPADSGVNGVQLSFRSAIRVAITVPGEISKKLDYENITVTQEEKKLLVRQVLKNNGNVSLDTQIDTELTTIFGSSIESISGEYPVLAAQRAEFNFEFKRPTWGGFYQVSAHANYNSDNDASLGQEGDSTGSVSAKKFVFVVPAVGPLLLYIAVLAALVALGWRKLRVIRHTRSSETYTVLAGDDLQKIAQQRAVPWKLIARINKLKPPYTLEAGTILQLPVATMTEDTSVATVKDVAKKQPVETTAIQPKTAIKKSMTNKKSAPKKTTSTRAKNNPASKKSAEK